MNDLHGRIALVTGSSRGIGAAIAKAFATAGAAVVVHGRDSDAVAAVTAHITKTSPRPIGVRRSTPTSPPPSSRSRRSCRE
jgi:3-oxoacyl-[acyl-carrier protein] reductase